MAVPGGAFSPRNCFAPTRDLARRVSLLHYGVAGLEQMDIFIQHRAGWLGGEHNAVHSHGCASKLL